MMVTKTSVRATWYLLALAPIAIGAAVVVIGMYGLSDAIERMPRVVVPGTGTVALEAGDHIAYGELRSVSGGQLYVTSSLQMRCRMTAVEGGAEVALSSPTVNTSYTLGSFQGRSMFALAIPRAGRYELACEGSGGPATIAFGHGVGSMILTLVLGAVLGVLGALVVAFLVRRRRKRARVAVPATAT